MVDRHLLFSCAPRHTHSRKQRFLFKNPEKWDAAKTAVVTAKMEARVSVLLFQSLDKHFNSKNRLGNSDQRVKHPNPCLGAWIYLCLLRDCWVLGFRVASIQLKEWTVLTTFTLPLLRCSHKTWQGAIHVS